MKGMLYGAKVTALAALRLMADYDLIVAAKADFDRHMKSRVYEPMLPEKAPF